MEKVDNLTKILLAAWNSFRENSFWFFFLVDKKLPFPHFSYAKYPLSTVYRLLLEITADASYMVDADNSEIDKFASALTKAFDNEQEMSEYLVSDSHKKDTELKKGTVDRIHRLFGDSGKKQYNELCTLSHFNFIGALNNIVPTEDENCRYGFDLAKEYFSLLQSLIEAFEKSEKFPKINKYDKSILNDLATEVSSWQSDSNRL